MTEKKKIVRKKGIYQKTKRLGMPVDSRRGNKKVNSNWTEADWDLLLQRFANGEMLTKICKENIMPCRQAFYDRLKRNDEYRKAYEIARELHVDAHAEKTQEIADNCKEDFTVDDQGKKVYHSVPVTRDALRIKTAQWRIGKLEPKKYGDRIQQDVTGSIANLTPVINFISGVEVGEDEGKSRDKLEVAPEANGSVAIESD